MKRESLPDLRRKKTSRQVREGQEERFKKTGDPLTRKPVPLLKDLQQTSEMVVETRVHRNLQPSTTPVFPEEVVVHTETPLSRDPQDVPARPRHP